jgi:hypothetical protein
MGMGTTARIDRLNQASARRVIEPDHDLPGSLGPGRVLPDELLSIHGLDLDLTEEARHLSYARTVLPEVWEQANLIDRVAVRRVAPWVVDDMFRFLVGPGVYETVGLPGRETWEAVQQLPGRRALLHEAMRNVLATLIDAGALRPGRLPKGWQEVCGVDAEGEPTT